MLHRFRHCAKDCRAGARLVALINARPPIVNRGECYECCGTDHYRAACPRFIRASEQGGNRPNPKLAIEGRHNNNQTMEIMAIQLGVVHSSWAQIKPTRIRTL
nr:hypothetical protein [Tanacetum cinerariifolium]